MYVTSALQKTDMKAVSLQLALDILHRREDRDLITGLKARTNAGTSSPQDRDKLKQERVTCRLRSVLPNVWSAFMSSPGICRLSYNAVFAKGLLAELSKLLYEIGDPLFLLWCQILYILSLS
jgi:hypothetical protein